MKLKLLETQKYQECTLVTLINAATYLGEPPVDPESEEYERLVDLVGARHGSAGYTYHAVSYLRLIEHKIEPVTKDAIRHQVINGHPVQVGLQHPVVGFHAVLLTDSNGRSVRVWNLRSKGYPHDRLSWERLIEMMAMVAPHNRHAYWYELDPLRKRELEK